MTQHEELICAYALNGKGGGTNLKWEDVNRWSSADGPIWIHLDATHPGTLNWLNEHSRLSNFHVDGLMALESRPRCTVSDEGVLLNLRGVNLNPGADPEDLVSIRMWIEEDRIITTRFRRLMAVEDVRKQLDDGRGAQSTAHLVARIASRLTDRMGPVVSDMNDLVAELEEGLVGIDDKAQPGIREVRHQLNGFRRQTISMRRYIAPQRDALNRLVQIDADWLTEPVRGRLRETVDQVTRITEDLDEARERASVIQDELINRASHRMEKTMYVLTIVATIMLPLGFLTGLLGVNVGGIPGAETEWAFWAVCGGSAALIAIELLIFKVFKWL